ncbi:MAG: adenylate kinase [Phycisphaerae bacterium]|nr:adenylate kinase [Phycisphaerae bacterium]
MPTRLIFMGPPGSGKGTQAARLMDSAGLVQLSSGQVMRDEIKAGSAIGKKVAQYVESGGLVPDELITGVILAAVEKVGDRGLILDGFPRTAPQAESLAAGMTARGWKIDAVLDFQMPDEVIIERIGGRRVCSDCGATYNTEFLPPKVEGVCDACGGKVIQRKDDLPDVVRNRLETYRAQTAPLVQYYSERGLLHNIDASRHADEVQVTVRRIVDGLGAA